MIVFLFYIDIDLFIYKCYNTLKKSAWTRIGLNMCNFEMFLKEEGGRMIISYSIKNYRSYKDRQTISFLGKAAKPGAKGQPLFLYQDENICLTKLALIFGANASGKSNLFIGLRSFIQFVFSQYPKDYDPDGQLGYSSKEAFEIPYVSFFDEKGEAEHCLELYSTHQKKSYRYTLIASYNGILCETLEEQSGPYKPKKYVTVFKRLNDKSLRFKNPHLDISAEFNKNFDYGHSLSEQVLKEHVAYIDENIHHYQSLMYLLISKSALPYFHKLEEELKLIQIRFSQMAPSEVEFMGNTIRGHLKNRGAIYKTILNLLRIATTALSDLTVEKDNIIYFHFSYGEKIYKIPFSDISEGTKKICYLSRDILTVLWEGGTLVGDELDGQIHPFILALLFEILMAPQYCSQIVCSLHSPIVVELLNRLPDNSLPRRALYFAFKTDKGSTELQPYAKFLGDGLMKKGEFTRFVVDNRYLSTPDARGWMFEDYLNK